MVVETSPPIKVDEHKQRSHPTGWHLTWRLRGVRRERDGIDIADLGLKLLLPLLAVSVGAMTFRLQSAVQQHTADERLVAIAQEIDRQWAPPSAAWAAEKAQVSAVLTQLALHGTPEERRAALLGLVQVAPRLLIDLSPVLLATSATDADAAFVRAATLQASDHELENAFMGQLRYAREFLKRGLFERACVEFRGVWNVLRDDTVDSAAFNGGQELCAQGRYEDGAQRIQRAFSAIVTSR